MKYVQVALNLPLRRTFQYRVPANCIPKVEIGSRVIVPFRTRHLTGFVVGQDKGPVNRKLREIVRLVDDFPAISPTLLRLGRWISDYYYCPLGQSLHSMLPTRRPLREKDREGGSPKPCSSFSYRNKSFDSRSFGARRGGTVSLVKSKGEKNKVFIYRSLIRDIIARNKQVALVVPEISYLSFWQELARSDYKDEIVLFHSRLTEKERHASWMRIRNGEVCLAIGTRSLVFAPFGNLGLIVLEEEENVAYKQRETPRYHARETAIKRGEIENFPVVLMSQSPSLESWTRAQKGDYLWVCDADTEETSACIKIVDLREEENRTISRPLEEAMREALGERELSILFLDRRGFSRYLICEDCGEVLRCPNCSIGLTFHLKDALSCHCCGHESRSPSICPHCGGARLRTGGIGTEQVEREAREMFSGAFTRRADLDGDSPSLYREVREDVLEGRIDILVGTRLIIKEEILKKALVVGIILADTWLNLPDFRASERLFQLLVRIKRSISKDGTIVIQTYNPNHYSLRCVRDKEDAFYEKEIKVREELCYPPWVHWVRILLEGKSEASVVQAGEHMRKGLDRGGVVFLGPMPCPFMKIKGNYRYQFVLRDKDPRRISGVLKAKLGSFLGIRNGVKVSVDVDPQEIV